VRFYSGPQAVLTLALSSTMVFAQSWDPIKKATGWARVDKDGSIAFYDPASKKIVSWMRDGGVVGEVDVSKLDQAPEKWVLDFSFNAWVVSGKNLTYVEKNGKNFTIKLPYEVGDLTWDARGFYISYKTPEPFIEMRGYDSGSVVWYVRNRAMKDEGAPATMFRIAINEDKMLYQGSRNDLRLEQIDGSNGRSKAVLMFNGGSTPTLALGFQDRGPMAWWLNKNTVVQAVPASQVPNLKMTGTLLAVENLTTSTLDFVPTGLSEQHSFIGMLESEAVFIAPEGGLVFVPMKK
jgi:hypothetical protein